jgi:hypothetical protein
MANPGQDSTSETKAAQEAAEAKAKKEEDVQNMA